MMSKIVLVAAVLACLSSSSYSFKHISLPVAAISPPLPHLSSSCLPQQQQQQRLSKLTALPATVEANGSTNNNNNYGFSDDSDPYGDMFDFGKPLDETSDGADVISMVRSNIGSGDNPSSTSIAKMKESKRNPIIKLSLKEEGGRKGVLKRGERWDDFMEAQFADMDDELGDEDQWIQQMMDIIEQKRGIAIWSQKTAKELQDEMKQSQAEGPAIPAAVAMVITAVFLDRTHTMSQIRKEDEIAALEFRKWMREQNKKGGAQEKKVSPLPAARVKIAEAWLTRKPGSTMLSYLSANSKKSNRWSRGPVKKETEMSPADMKAEQRRRCVIVFDEVVPRELFTEKDPSKRASLLTTQPSSSAADYAIGSISGDGNGKSSGSAPGGPDTAKSNNNKSIFEKEKAASLTASRPAFVTQSLLSWDKTRTEMTETDMQERAASKAEEEARTSESLQQSMISGQYQYVHIDPESMEQYYVVL